MLRTGNILLFLDCLFCAVALAKITAPQNSWATHLRRSARRVADIRAHLISRESTETLKTRPEYFSTEISDTLKPDQIPAPLVAAASGYEYVPTGDSDMSMEHHQPMSRTVGRCDGQSPVTVGDPAYQCKIFIICQADGRFDRMDCPGSLRFNNALGVCDWPDQVDESCGPAYQSSQYPSVSTKRKSNMYRLGNGPYVPSGAYWDMPLAARAKFSLARV